MTDYRAMYDSLYIYAFDLKGRDVTVTIKEVKAAKLRNANQPETKKPVIWFVESHDNRGLVLCKTNARTIATLYGNETDAWVGKRITLYPTRVDAFGRETDAIRIRPSIPPEGKKAGSVGTIEPQVDEP